MKMIGEWHMQSKNKKKILITGVAGLIGNNISRYLLNDDYDVYGIDNLSGGYEELIDKRVKFIKVDLLDSDSLTQIFNEIKPDYVLHFAAYAAEGLSPFIRNFNYKNNILCSVNIINQCVNHKVKKIIFTSSMAVYGHLPAPFIESMTPCPADPYGISKYCVELDLKQAYEQFGLKYAILRPHNVIGLYQNIWDKYRNVLGIWIREILNGNDICIFGDGTQTRAFSDVKFMYDPIIKLLYNYDNEIFNVGSDKYYTINDAANILVKIVNKYGYNPKIKYVEKRHEVLHAYSDHTKTKKLLNSNDETDLEKTMNDMFIWAKDQPNRTVAKFNYEIERNIYDSWK